MTLNGWIQILMNVAVLAALVFALITALVVPLHRQGGKHLRDKHLETSPGEVARASR